jgi:hypothetical protein
MSGRGSGGHKRQRTATGRGTLRPQHLRFRKGKGISRRNARVVVPRDKLGFPTSMVSTLRYTTRIDLTPTGTNTQALSFRANGMFDPEAAVGGHQPRGFDEMMELYKTFTVTSSKIMVNWMYEGYDGPSTKAAAGNYIQGKADISDCPALSPAICGVMRSAEPYGSGISIENQMEKDRTSWTVLTPQGEAKVSSANSQLSDFFGKQDLVAADGYSGTDSKDPENQAYYHVFAARGSNDFSADLVKVVGFVTIEYRATFSEPKPLEAS